MGLHFRTMKTTDGYVGFVVSARGLRQVYLPVRNVGSLKRVIRKENPDAVEDRSLLPGFADALRRYFAGEAVEFHVPLDWSGRSRFEVDVWEVCRRIKYGQTRSYKELAERVGRPGGARAVGMAMRHNPCPIVVPCHRVLRSDGSLGGFSSPGGVASKRALLQMEAAGT
jgi:methylated-DNA-[protein]-cysteine S-methyltransferase